MQVTYAVAGQAVAPVPAKVHAVQVAVVSPKNPTLHLSQNDVAAAAPPEHVCPKGEVATQFVTVAQIVQADPSAALKYPKGHE